MTRLTHLDESGAARMVDVSTKPETERSATAEGRIVMSQEALEALSSGGNPKGDAAAAARIAGILAAKRTGELIPLCHPLGLDSMVVDIEIDGVAQRRDEPFLCAAVLGLERDLATVTLLAAREGAGHAVDLLHVHARRRRVRVAGGARKKPVPESRAPARQADHRPAHELPCGSRRRRSFA